MDIAVPDDCKEAFSELKKYSDVIVSVVVYQRIVSTLKMICENEINRISYLLSSTTENHYFGGLRALGFNSSEANYLKENHLHIHTLFVAMVNSLEKAYNVSSEQSPAYSDTYESIAQLPLAEEAELPFTMSTPGKETAETVVPQETEKVVNADVATTSEEAKDISSEDESYNEDGFIVLTAKSILQNLDPFRVFVSEKCDLASLKKLLFAGLNLNEVVQKAEEIARIVKAFDNFEQSFNELDKVMDTLSFPLDVDD